MNRRLIALSLPAILLASPVYAQETDAEASEPITEEAPAEETVSEESVSEESVSEESVSEEAVTEEAVAEEAVAEEAVAEEAVAEEAVAEEAVQAPQTEVPPMTEAVPPVAPAAVIPVANTDEFAPIDSDNDVSDIQPVLSESANQSTEEQPAPETKPAVLTELAGLVAQRKYVMAYELANTHRQDWEGDGEFDFNYGVAAAQTGHYNEAVFPFERLLESFPGNARFRLELARCHYYLGNLTTAEMEFNKVAAQNPPTGVQQNIDRFLNRIAEQRQQVSPSWQGGLDLAAGYDSNINAATDLDAVQATFYFPIQGSDNLLKAEGPLTLDDDQKATGSTFHQTQGYIVHQRPLTKRSNVDISISGLHKDNITSEEYDLSNAAISGGVRLIRGAHNLRFGGSYRRYWLAGDDLQYQTLGNVHWQWLFMPQWKTGIQFEAGQQNNDQNNALDFYQWQSKFNINRNSEGFVQNFQLALGADEALEKENKFQGRSYIGFAYQARQALSGDSQLFALLNYRDNQYQDEFDALHPFYANEKRKDQLTQLILGWNYSFNQNLGGKVQLNHSQNSSNLELYEYDRTQFELGANFRF